MFQSEIPLSRGRIKGRNNQQISNLPSLLFHISPNWLRALLTLPNTCVFFYVIPRCFFSSSTSSHRIYVRSRLCSPWVGLLSWIYTLLIFVIAALPSLPISSTLCAAAGFARANLPGNATCARDSSSGMCRLWTERVGMAVELEAVTFGKVTWVCSRLAGTEKLQSKWVVCDTGIGMEAIICKTEVTAGLRNIFWDIRRIVRSKKWWGGGGPELIWFCPLC